MLQIILDAGALVNVTDDKGETALVYALARNDADLVADLLNAGADVRVPTNNGSTALEIAKEKGNPAIIRLLSNALARSSGPWDPNQPFMTKVGELTVEVSPIRWAVMHGHLARTKFLMTLGVDPLRKEINSKNALWTAVLISNPDVVAAMLTDEVKARLTPEDKQALLKLAKQNRSSAIEQLLR
jgi:ankyrin repeat protein